MCARIVSLAFWTLNLLGSAIAPSSADTVFTDLEAIHGKVLGLNKDGVTFQPGCAQSDRRKLSWTEVRDVTFNPNCNTPSARLPSAGVDVCSTKPVRRLVIFFRNQSEPIYADDVNFDGSDAFHYTDMVGGKVAHGPISEVSGISSRLVCSDKKSEASPPLEFCIEPRQFAVNFSYDAPFGNKILTRGFSFFLEFAPTEKESTHEKATEMRMLIREGFGTALNIWTSEMWRNRKAIDGGLSEFLDSLTSKSANGFVLFTPPQVVSLECPQSATFVVRVYTANVAPFASMVSRKVAYAQKPGRTVLLNFADYRCWKHKYFEFVIEQDTRCLNIVPILVHELGHAFGLNHSNESDSIMAETIYVTKPSESDILNLAAQLLRTVEGERPGVFEFTTDNGVAVE
jgi:Matrixin